MMLHSAMAHRGANGDPVRCVLFGAGKFGSMFLAQARRMPGLHLAAVVDLDPARTRSRLAAVGWPDEAYAAHDLNEAIAQGSTLVTDRVDDVLGDGRVHVVIEATGDPAAATAHALAALHNGHHLVNVTVEADVLVGPVLARRFAAAGLVYSLAYGDQPALIAEMVDWARTVGLSVVCAGKGTKYLPVYHASTPETVWGYYGISPEAAAQGGMNPKMFNAFLDGTKSAIEMAAVANACDLAVPVEGLAFPPSGVDDLPHVLRPRTAGGHLERAGIVEVVSSLERDGRPVPRDLRWGVFVVVEAGDDYVARCFGEYGLRTDQTGRYAALYKPYHLIGLELGLSIASVAIRGEPTGAPGAFRGDVPAVAKRDLSVGEVLDGEGGSTVYGRLMPAHLSKQSGLVPIGLAHGLRLTRAVAAGAPVPRDALAPVDETQVWQLYEEARAMGGAGG